VPPCPCLYVPMCATSGQSEKVEVGVLWFTVWAPCQHLLALGCYTGPQENETLHIGYVPLHFVIKHHHYITVDLVENSTSVIDDDFCVVSRIPVTVPVRPLRYLTWGNAFCQIFEVGGRRPPASHATLTTVYHCLGPITPSGK